MYYKDDNTAKWLIEYNAVDDTVLQKTAAVTNINDDTWKSAVFKINDAEFKNAQTSGMDFRIYNGGQQDVTVGSVRVIRP